VSEPIESAESSAPFVVYVDDDLELVRLVTDLLEEEGCRVMTATDGEAGLELILVEQPDVVILDVMMPGLTGWEIVRYLRTKPAFEKLPVLMLTGIGERMNAMTAPLYGATDHLDKPFDPDELVARVQLLLEGCVDDDV